MFYTYSDRYATIPRLCTLRMFGVYHPDELVCRNGFPGIEANDACCSLEVSFELKKSTVGTKCSYYVSLCLLSVYVVVVKSLAQRFAKGAYNHLTY